MLIKICNKCKKPIIYPKTYCADCQAQVDEAREAAHRISKRKSDIAYNSRRDKKYTDFYKDDKWRNLSRAYIADKKYKCEDCGQIAAEVHHKEPVQTPEGWERRYEWENLQALCIKCHNKKHKRFEKRKKGL